MPNDQIVTELLASCKELREALAASMRVIALHDDNYSFGLTEVWAREMELIGIKNGIGVRADAIIAKAEGR